MSHIAMNAPFTWYGGKRRVAPQVWSALGDVDMYIEPFGGSLAVLLGRPAWHWGRHEVVNDADAYICNFWRAVTAEPDAVERYADWPINEMDLYARHRWLVTHGRRRLDAMEQDPEYYDPQVAGWWVWGVSSWFGCGWCSARPSADEIAGENMAGVARSRPHLTGTQGVHTKPSGYMQVLANRLRHVKITCGDWSRVLGDAVRKGTTGVFLDPPYLGDVRSRDLYAVDDHSISTSVREWAVSHGDDPHLRIVLAGYLPEHEGHIPDTWRVMRWSGSGTGQRRGIQSPNDTNRHMETLWFSPACLNDVPRLFELHR